MRETQKTTKQTIKARKDSLQLVLGGVLLVLLFSGILITNSLIRQNQDTRSDARTPIQTSCDSPAYCVEASECFSANGVVMGACNSGSTVCCLPQPDDYVEQIAVARQAVDTGTTVSIQDNCCGTVGYGSCLHPDPFIERNNFEAGNAAWQSQACPAAQVQSPYNGIKNIPGKIQAEDYDTGGPEVAYSDVDENNNGRAYRQDQVDLIAGNYDNGTKLGWVRSGEWVEYTVQVASTGTYTLNSRVATESNSQPEFYVLIDGVQVASVTVPNTGQWENFTTVTTRGIELSEGTHILRLAFPDNHLDIDYLEFVPTVDQELPTENGLTGTYFNNKDFTSQAFVRTDDVVSFRSWVEGYPAGIDNTTFSIRWQGFITAPVAGEYVLYTYSDDGVRLFIDGTKVIDDWSDHASRLRETRVQMEANRPYPILIEYYQNHGGASMRLEWKQPGTTNRVLVPSTALSTNDEVVNEQPGQVITGKFNGISLNQNITETVYISYEAEPATTERVEYYIDEKLVQTERTHPYFLGGNDGDVANGYEMSGYPDGNHVLKVKVFPKNGGSYYEDQISFVIGQTPPTDPAIIKGEFKGIRSDGVTTSSRPAIEYTASRETTQKVEFYLDGKLVHTENGHRFFLGGNLGALAYGYNVVPYAGKDVELRVKVYPKGEGVYYEDSITLKPRFP